MNKYVNERYDTFNTKGSPDEIIFGDFHDQPIPYDYYNILNDDDDDNNFPGTPFEDALMENKGLEYAVIQNDEDINDEIIFDYDDSLTSDIDHLRNQMM